MLILLSPLIFLTNFAQVKSQTEYLIAANQCFYLPNKLIAVGSIETTRIVLSNGVALTNLGTCCDYCQALTRANCVAWQLVVNTKTCIFYKSVTGIQFVENPNNYLGHAVPDPFWNCNEEPNKWYTNPLLTWVRQGIFGNRFACCQTCFFTSNCASYMFTDDGNDCYFSTRNHVNLGSINIGGFYTGGPTLSFTP